MDVEYFKLAITTTILLQRVRKRRVKRKSRKEWVCAIFKEREKKLHITNLSGKTFVVKTLEFFTTSAKVLSSLKLHLFDFPMLVNFFD